MAQDFSRLDSAFDAAAEAFGVDADILRGIAFAESGFSDDVISGRRKSRVGATGMMQFMPDTAKRFGIDPTDPEQSIFGAAQYLRENLDRFDGDYAKAVAAYNWGENRKAYLRDDWHAALPDETRDYVGKVLGFAASGGGGGGEAAAAPAMSRTGTSQLTPQQIEQAANAGVKQRETATKERSWFDAAKDTAAQLGEGSANLVKSAVDLVAPESELSSAIGEVGKGYHAMQSDVLKARIAQADEKIKAAGKDGFVAELTEAANLYFKDPALAARFIATNLPSMVPGVGGARLISGVSKVNALAKGATAAQAAATAAKAGTLGGAGINAVLNAGGARGDAFDDIKATLMAQGLSEEEATDKALADSRVAAAIGGLAGAISGGTGLEKVAAGGAAKAGLGMFRAGAGGLLKEAGGEQLEELAPQLTTNLLANKYEDRPVLQGLGRTAVETAIGAGPGSVLAGAGEALSVAEASRARKMQAEIELRNAPDAASAAKAAADLAGSVDEFTATVDEYLKTPTAPTPAADPLATTEPTPSVDRALQPGLLAQQMEIQRQFDQANGIDLPASPLRGEAAPVVEPLLSGVTPDQAIAATQGAASPVLPTLQELQAKREQAVARVQQELGLPATQPVAQGEDFTPQQKQEIARARLQSEPVADPLAGLSLQTQSPTGMPQVQQLAQEATQRRDAAETAQIEQMLAEDQTKAEAVAQQQTAQRLQLEQSSAAETGANQAAGLEQQTRRRMVDDLVQSYAEPSGYFASRLIPAVDNQLAVLKQPPLSTEERTRITSLTGSAQAFSQPNLPAVDQTLPDRNADNASMEALIPEKKKPDLPRPTNILGKPASSYSDDQLTSLVSNTNIPAVSRRGASIELSARQADAAPVSTAPVSTAPVSTAPVSTAPVSTAPVSTAPTKPLATATPGRILTSNAKLSTSRPLKPGVVQQVNDSGTAHSFTVVDPGSLGAQGKLIGQVARIFGKQVVAFESDTLKADGFVLDDDNARVYLNAKAGISPMAVFGHELTHLFKRDNAEAYTALQAVVQKNVAAGGMERFAAEYGDDANIEELTSDLVGNRFREEQFWTDVFNEVAAQNPEGARGVITRMAAALRKAINSLLQAVRQPGFQADEYVTNLEEIKAAATKAFAQYAKQQRLPAMQMEAELARAEAGADLTGATGYDSQPVDGVRNARFSDARGVGREPAAAGQDGQSTGADGRDLPSYGTARPGAISVVGRHYSASPRQQLSGAFYGSGLKGAERHRLDSSPDPRLKNRVYFYVDQGAGIQPEAGVGGYAHEVRLNNIYDPARGEIRGSDANAFESAVLNAGFDGYIAPFGNGQAAVVLLGPKHTAVPVKALGTAAGTVNSQAQAAQSTKSTLKKGLLSKEANAINVDAIPGARLRMGTLEIPADQKDVANAELERIGSSARFSPSRAGVADKAGDFDIRVRKDGTLAVLGDPADIRARLPEDVKGRAVPGGMLFTHSQAPRVRAALEGRQVAYSRAGQVFDRLPMKDGKYVGAPEKFNKPGNIGKLRKILMDLTREGEAGRFWYERSSEEVLRLTGGDVQEARKFVALLSIYSPQAMVDANSTFALRAWAQHKAGQPISVKTATQDAKAQKAMDDVDAFWSGEKTGNFFFNLLRRIDPSTEGKQGATIDMWMMRAGQYSNDAPTSTQYAFMENETNRIAAELGWEPQQVQAAIWVAMKARMENDGVKARTEASSEKKGWIKFVRTTDPETGKSKKERRILDAQKHRDNWLRESFALDVSAEDTAQAKFDFADGILRHIGQVSWEPRPSTKLPILPGVHSAPYSQQVEFQQAVQKALYDADGTDMLAKKLGLLVDSLTPAPGVWEGDVSAGAQSRMPMAPAKGKAGQTQIDPAQKKLLNVYTATLGLLLRQDGVGYHRPFYASNKGDQNGVELRIGRPFSDTEAKALWTALDKRMQADGKPDWEQNSALISSPEGMRIVSFGLFDDNKTFRDTVEQIAGELPLDEDIQPVHFASDGDLMFNNWKDEPNGEGFTRTIRDAGRSDILDWASSVLAPRVQAVFDDFSKRYGWGDPGSIKFSRQRDGSRGDQGRSLAPLAGAPVIEGATGPDPRLVEVAEQYARENGIDLRRQAEYVEVDPYRAARIAAAYDEMRHDPQNHRVREAYENLIRQTVAQYRALEKAGYQFYFFDESNDPYNGNPWDAMRDLRANQTMGVFATAAGFGSGATDLNVEDNPLLADTGIVWPYGSMDGPLKPVLANDLFRAVHDAFGHGLEGAGFRARGEENAWQAHVRLFTGSAVAAITSETRGQNSWLNYGPFGEKNRTAKVEDTTFADQKTGLMPEWTWTEGRVSDAAFSRQRNQLGFYSALAAGVDGIKTNAAPAAGWKDAIKGLVNKGLVKQDEVEWSGVNDWLDLQTGRVSKEQVAQFLKQGGVQVRETTLRDGADPAALEALQDAISPAFYAEVDEAGDVTIHESDYDDVVPRRSWPDAVADAVDAFETARDSAPATKYSTYTLPGGESYREVLLTLPDGKKPMTYQEWVAGGMEGDWSSKGFVTTGPQYKSNHWDQKNVLAHLRLNDRTDADGNKVLFVEEVQSDWGQEKKKGNGVPNAPFVTKTEGWLNLALKRVIVMAAEGGYDKVAFTTGEQNADRFSLDKQIDAIYYTRNADGTYNVSAANGNREVWADSRATEAGVEEALGKEMAEKIAAGAGVDDGGVMALRGQDLKIEAKGMRAFYDAIVPNAAKALLKKVGGGQMEMVGIPDSNADREVVAAQVPGESMWGVYDRQKGQWLESWDNETYTSDPENAELTSEKTAKNMASAIMRDAGVMLNQPGFTITDAMREKVSGEGLPLFSRQRNIYGQQVLPAWTAPTGKETKYDSLIYALQDKLIDTKRVVEAIKKQAGAITDKWNPYLQEELFHGRTAKQTADFLTSELRPLLQDMQARGVTMADFEEFLHNRHAEERNQQIAKVNPAMPDGGSGIKTADARAYLSSLDPAKRRAFDALAKRVDAITTETRNILVANGLETASTIAAWQGAYSQYVPLMREELDFDPVGSGGGGTGLGFSVRGSASKRAMGSERKVVDILANIAMQRERAIVRAQKNRVATAVYGLAMSQPNPDFWLAVNPDAIKDPAKLQAELVNMGLNPLDAEGLIQEPKQTYIDPQTGLVSQRVNPILRSSGNVLAVRVDGQDRYVFFNANNEQSQRMVAALKNMDADQLGRAMGLVATATRWFASVNTQYNPVFGAVNFTRDVQGAVLNLSTTELADRQAQILRDTLPALRGVYADLRQQRKGKGAGTGQWAQLWEEFQREGGQTGYRDQFSRSDERAEALEREIKRVTEGKAKQFGRAVFDWLSDYNESMENAVRLAAYKAGLDKGLTKSQAASVAKNLTVNFNRKGQIATQMGALYAFFNAAVQGTARLGQTLAGPAGRKIVGGGLLLGTLQAMALAAAGFDEDEPPEFVRERNFIIPIGGGRYLTVPMPLGYHVIPHTSRVMTEWALSGFKETTKRVGQLTGAYFEAFNPIGSAGWSVQTLAPTVVDPLVALSENRDWTGKPIAKEDRSSLDPTPGFTRAKDTASVFSKHLAEFINFASGGNAYRQGLISPTPDQIDYLIGQVTGGVGRELLKAEQATSSVNSGEELPPHKIPLLGRFYGDTKSGSAEGGRFYENIRRLNEHEREIEGRRRDQGGVDAYLRDNPEAKLYRLANRVEREVQELNQRKRELLERDASKETIKLIEQRINARMKQLNDRVRELRAGEEEPA